MMHSRARPLAALPLVALGLLAGVPALAQPVAVTIDAAQRHQTMLGFGTCINAWDDWSRVLARRERFARQYLEELGCNIARVNLWPKDMAPREEPDAIRFEDWRLDVRGEAYLTFARTLHEVDPTVKIIGTVWSPPAWMKLNNDERGKGSSAIPADRYHARGKGPVDNRVRPDHFDHFAAWVVEYVKLYRQRGTPLYALSIGNEVQFSHGFESCVWTATDYADVLGRVIRRLDAAGLGDLKLFGPETMTGHNAAHQNPQYVAAVMGDPLTAARLSAWATHGYLNGVIEDTDAGPLADLRRLIEPTGKPLWITEFGGGPHDWPRPLSGLALTLHNSLVRGDAQLVAPWLVSGEPRKSREALMIYDRPTRKTAVAQQYFRFIRPGATRVATSATDPPAIPVRLCAFVHDAEHNATAVVTNPADADVTLQLTWAGVTLVGEAQVVRTSEQEQFADQPALPVVGNAVTVTVPAQSVVSVRVKTAERGPGQSS